MRALTPFTATSLPIARRRRVRRGKDAEEEGDRGARARVGRGTEEDEEGEGSPSGFQRRASPGRADRKYRVAHQIFRRERPRVMAASPPDEAHRVVGREKEKDTVRMSRGREVQEERRRRERETERNLLYRSTAVRAMVGRRERDERDEEGRWQLRYSITSGISSASKLYAKCTRGPSPPRRGIDPSLRPSSLHPFRPSPPLPRRFPPSTPQRPRLPHVHHYD